MDLLFIVQTDSKEFGLCMDVGAEGDEEVKMALKGPASGPPVQGPARLSPFSFVCIGLNETDCSAIKEFE